MEEIARNLHNAFTADKMNMIKNIARDYELNEEELIQRYVYNDQNGNGSITNDGSLPVSSKRVFGTKKKRNDCIETWEYEYNGITYLIDNKDNIYTYNIDKPLLIGDKLLDGTIKFSDEYLRLVREGKIDKYEKTK